MLSRLLRRLAERSRFLRAAARSWVELTAEEQRALLLVLGLFLLGLAVRSWHVHLRPALQRPAAVPTRSLESPPLRPGKPPASECRQNATEKPKEITG